MQSNKVTKVRERNRNVRLDNAFPAIILPAIAKDLRVTVPRTDASTEVAEIESLQQHHQKILPSAKQPTRTECRKISVYFFPNSTLSVRDAAAS